MQEVSPIVYQGAGLRVTAEQGRLLAFAPENRQAHLTPEAAVDLALAVLDLCAPDVMREVRHAARRVPETQ